MGEHLIDGEFQSDKYPTTPRGLVPLKCSDPLAQDLLWVYAQRRRAIDPEFSDDLEAALAAKSFFHDAREPALMSHYRVTLYARFAWMGKEWSAWTADGASVIPTKEIAYPVVLPVPEAEVVKLGIALAEIEAEVAEPEESG